MNDDKRDAYLIELKGTDVISAIEQLENTEKILKNDLKGYTRYYRIVYHSNTHAILSSKYIKFVAQKGSKYVRAKTNYIEEYI